jgi:hypothetical protein
MCWYVTKIEPGNFDIWDVLLSKVSCISVLQEDIPNEKSVCTGRAKGEQIISHTLTEFIHAHKSLHYERMCFHIEN